MIQAVILSAFLVLLLQNAAGAHFADIAEAMTPLPSSYDAKDEGLVTSPKNQYSFGTCWAFAVAAAAESSLIKSGLADQNIDLSEYQLAYFTYSKAKDPLGNTDEDGTITKSNLDTILNHGGKPEIAIQQFAKWCGPIYEEELPYSYANHNILPDASFASQSRFHLKNAVFLNGDNEKEIKELILKYGGVAASFYSSPDYYADTDDGYTYFIPNMRGETHAVCVIGWDDNYPKERFRISPAGNGAWLCKDSSTAARSFGNAVYGMDKQDLDESACGYLWISYETHFACADALEFEPSDLYQNNYQYDGCPAKTVSLGTYIAFPDAEAASCMNVFEAKADSVGEALQAVSITSGGHADYQISIFTDPVFKDGIMSSYTYHSKPVLFHSSYSGICRVDLPEPVCLKKGQRFAIEVRGKRKDIEQFAVSASSEDGDEHMEPGQSYVGKQQGGSWFYQDLSSTRQKLTPRIKAFTNPVDECCMQKMKTNKMEWIERLLQTLSSWRILKMDILNTVWTALLSAAVLFLLAKAMGHKQVAQLDFFDYITGITIGSIAAELATELEEPVKPLTAMIVYGAVSLVLSFVTGRFPGMRKYINGSPTILFDQGKLYRSNMKRAKLDLSEFMVMCREQGYFNLSDIQTAVFEHNGKLSILPVSNKRPVNPADMNMNLPAENVSIEVIMDGRIFEDNLKSRGLDRDWLMQQLQSQGHQDAKDIFLGMCDGNNQLSLYT